MTEQDLKGRRVYAPANHEEGWPAESGTCLSPRAEKGMIVYRADQRTDDDDDGLRECRVEDVRFVS